MAREASVVCNQAASFNRCLFKVQADMQSQIRTIRGEGKGKGSTKGSEATEELQFLMDFNSSITQAAAKAMEHLTEFVFFTMGKLTLTRRDAYLNHMKNGIKPDSFAALRTGPLHTATLFPESAIQWAEGCSNPERGLHPPLPDPAKTCKISHSRKLLCQSSQEQLPVGGISSAYRQKCSRTGQTQNISRVFQ